MEARSRSVLISPIHAFLMDESKFKSFLEESHFFPEKTSSCWGMAFSDTMPLGCWKRLSGWRAVFYLRGSERKSS